MSATLSRLSLAEAEALAHEALELLAPACERIEIAGSIRRRKLDAGDIELLAVPKMENLGVFTVNQLDNAVAGCSDIGLRLPKAYGPKYKRLLFKGFPLDLFIVTPPAQWGWLMALRTGPEDFSRRLVTHRRHYGWLPNWAKAAEGGVYYETHKPGVDQPYPMPEEADLFDFLKRGYVPPELRQ